MRATAPEHVLSVPLSTDDYQEGKKTTMKITYGSGLGLEPLVGIEARHGGHERLDFGSDGRLILGIERRRRARPPLTSGLDEAPEQLEEGRAAEARRPTRERRVALDGLCEVGQGVGAAVGRDVGG